MTYLNEEESSTAHLEVHTKISMKKTWKKLEKYMKTLENGKVWNFVNYFPSCRLERSSDLTAPRLSSNLLLNILIHFLLYTVMLLRSKTILLGSFYTEVNSSKNLIFLSGLYSLFSGYGQKSHTFSKNFDIFLSVQRMSLS